MLTTEERKELFVKNPELDRIISFCASVAQKLINNGSSEEHSFSEAWKIYKTEYKYSPQVFENWEDFRAICRSFSKERLMNRPKYKKLIAQESFREIDTVDTNNGTGFSLPDLIKHIYTDAGYLPDNKILNAIGTFFGLSKWYGTQITSVMRKKGWVIKEIDGKYYSVEPPKEIDFVEALKKALENPAGKEEIFKLLMKYQ